MSKAAIKAACTAFLTLFFYAQFSFAQVGNDVVGARSNSLGGYTTTLTDVWSVNNNQAGLGFQSTIAGAIYYESRFSLKETSYRAGAFVYPVKSGAIGIGISSFGYQLYNQIQYHIHLILKQNVL